MLYLLNPNFEDGFPLDQNPVQYFDCGVFGPNLDFIEGLKEVPVVTGHYPLEKRILNLLSKELFLPNLQKLPTSMFSLTFLV